MRAIGVSHTACKDEFRRNLRSHSCRVYFIFKIYRLVYTWYVLFQFYIIYNTLYPETPNALFQRGLASLWRRSSKDKRPGRVGLCCTLGTSTLSIKLTRNTKYPSGCVYTNTTRYTWFMLFSVFSFVLFLPLDYTARSMAVFFLSTFANRKKSVQHQQQQCNKYQHAARVSNTKYLLALHARHVFPTSAARADSRVSEIDVVTVIDYILSSCRRCHRHVSL